MHQDDYVDTAIETRPQSGRRSRKRADDAASIAAPLPVTFTLHEHTIATGALFKIEDDKQTANGPLMSGSVEIDGAKIPLSAFLKQAQQSDTEYLSLSLGAQGGVHYYGKLFRVADPKGPNAPQYTGFMTVLECTSANQHADEAWDDAPQLKVCGWRKRNANGGARIHLTISSQVVNASELNF